MRRRSTRGWVGVALCIFWLVSPADAQDAPLDRVLAPDALGAPVVWVPSSLANGLLPSRIASAGHVPVVFEAIVHTAPLATPDQRLDLTGKTVREALDRLVAADPRYVWTDEAGVVVIRPATSAANDQHPLRQPVGALANTAVRPSEAMAIMGALVGGTVVTAVEPSRERALVLDATPASLLEFIVAVARTQQDGFWMTPSTMVQPGGAAFSLEYRAATGEAAAIQVPLAPTRP